MNIDILKSESDDFSQTRVFEVIAREFLQIYI